MNTNILDGIHNDTKQALNERLKSLPKKEADAIRKKEIVLNMRTGTARFLDRHGEKLLYSKTEAAAVLSISLMSINRYLKRGLLPSVQLGGRRLIPREGLIEMIAKKSKMENVQ
jgi:excisionase family DNA binding protein